MDDYKIALTLIIILIAINLIFMDGYLIFNYIIYPSYLSFQTGCKIISQSDLKSTDYYIAGYYSSFDNSISYFNSNGSNIKDISLVDRRTIIHESVHKYFYEHGLSHTCNYRFFRFIEELVAYSSEYIL